MKKLLFDLFRPIYSPVTEYLRKVLVTPYAFISHPKMEIPTQWDFVQFQAERNLHKYLHCSSDAVKNIYIVGAHTCPEIDRMKDIYHKATFTCYEPSPKVFLELEQKYQSYHNVICKQLACGRVPGKATFYELSMPGNGSLLKPDIEKWQQFNRWDDNSSETFEVEVTTLDSECENTTVDLLWIDVQGAELDVLLGAQNSLNNVKAVLLEVALSESPYSNSTLFPEINSFLLDRNFSLISLGLDPHNFTGNALWIRHPESLVCKE